PIGILRVVGVGFAFTTGKAYLFRADAGQLQNAIGDRLFVEVCYVSALASIAVLQMCRVHSRDFEPLSNFRMAVRVDQLVTDFRRGVGIFLVKRLGRGAAAFLDEAIELERLF